MTIKLELSIKDAEQLKRILSLNNTDSAYAKVLEDILLHKINIAKIDEYTDELCYRIRS